MTDIIWKILQEESDGKYEISNTGVIRHIETGKESVGSNCHGYRIKLFKTVSTNKYKNYSIHRLVGKYFIKNTLNLPVINHINGVKHDNRVENLEWVTSKENAKHAFDNNLRGLNETHARALLTNDEVREICKMIPLFNYTLIANQYNINRENVWYIARGLTWKKITNEFKYIPYTKPSADKLSYEDVISICESLSCKTFKQIGLEHNVSLDQVRKIAHGLNYKKYTKDLDYIPYMKNKNKKKLITIRTIN